MEIINILGLIAFSASGVLASKERRPDIIGGFVLAYSTSLGGGIIRDAILGVPARSFFDLSYLIVILLSAAVSMIFIEFIDQHSRKLDYADAIGLGFFNAAGFLIAYNTPGIPWLGAVILGAVTGSGGGIIRDVMCDRMPYILRTGQLYVTACIAANIAGIILLLLDFNQQVTAMVISAITITIRVLSIKFRIKIPGYTKEK